MCSRNEENVDLAGVPSIINIHKEVCTNNYFRKAIWTGEYMQVTLMSVPAGGEIGLEIHNDTDQFIRIEYGVASVYMGKTKSEVKFMGNANSNYSILIPSGYWHNIINEQNVPLKVYSIYAPPHHAIGTIHRTKLEADLAED